MKMLSISTVAILSVIYLHSGNVLKSQSKLEEINIRTYGIKLNVDNIAEALSFYRDILGFKSIAISDDSTSYLLEGSDDTRLILTEVEVLKEESPNDSRLSFTLQVNDLNSAISDLKSKDVEFGESEPRKEAVGTAIYIKDPFGRLISLMQQTIVKVDPFVEPRVYNYGFRVPDMTEAREFYEKKLGFVTRSEKYLPKDLPLGNTDGSFAFMLHYRDGVKAIRENTHDGEPFNVLVLQTDNLQSAVDELKNKGILIRASGTVSHPKKAPILMDDPFGNLIELWEIK